MCSLSPVRLRGEGPVKQATRAVRSDDERRPPRVFGLVPLGNRSHFVRKLFSKRWNRGNTRVPRWNELGKRRSRTPRELEGRFVSRFCFTRTSLFFVFVSRNNATYFPVSQIHARLLARFVTKSMLSFACRSRCIFHFASYIFTCQINLINNAIFRFEYIDTCQTLCCTF